MLYLDEDAANFQIDLCQKNSNSTGIVCDRCQQRKAINHLCPLGRETVLLVNPSKLANTTDNA